MTRVWTSRNRAAHLPCGKARCRRGWSAAALVAIGLWSALAWSLSAAMNTSLKDQFGNSHRLSDKLGKEPLVVIAGDQRESRHALKSWATALASPLEGKAALIGLAELDDVPFFIPNRTITGKLVEQFPQLPVLCDWDNTVYEAIGFADDSLVAVGVFDQEGKRRGIVSGKMSEVGLRRVLKLL